MSAAAPGNIGRTRRLLSEHAAAIYGMIGRAWVIMTGPLTIVLLAVYFTPEAQGYFITFVTLTAARTVAELGLGQVIIVKVAQLYTTATHLAVSVDPRVASYVRFTAKWFAGAGLVSGVLLGLGGTALLDTGNGLAMSEWLPPWLVLSCLVGIDVALSGLLYPLEGAGQVRSVYYCRMVRSFVNSLVLLLSILLGLHLWSISVGLACSLIWTAVFLFSRGKLVVAALRPGITVAQIDWRSEVRPAQWRVAMSSIADYIGFYTVIPLMYAMHGPVIAGQLGVTWQLALAVSSIAGFVVSARFPEFSRLAATRSSRELDSLFLNTFLTTMALCLLGKGGIVLVVFFFQEAGLQIATRLLPLDQVALLMFGGLIWHSNLTIVAYLRAHGGDPYLPASLSSAVVLFIMIVTLGRWFGPAGLLWGFAITGACFIVPFGLYLFVRQRRQSGYPPFRLEDWGRSSRTSSAERLPS